MKKGLPYLPAADLFCLEFPPFRDNILYQEGKEGKAIKRKWLWAAAILAALVVWNLRYAFSLRAYPGAAAYKSVCGSINQIRERFPDDPLAMLRRGVNAGENQRISARVAHEDSTKGERFWMLDLYFQARPKRFSARGGPGEETLELYLDQDCAALRWPALLGPETYGVNFASFSESMEENGLLRLVLGQQRLDAFSRWISSPERVPGLQPVHIPEIPWNVIEDAAMGMLALPWKVSRETTDREEAVYLLSTSISGQTVARAAKGQLGNLPDFLQSLMEEMEKDEKSILRGTILMKDRQIRNLSLGVFAGDMTMTVTGELGEDLSADGLSLKLCLQTGDETEECFLQLYPREADAESGNLRLPNGETVNWRWEHRTKKLDLELEEEGESFSLAVQETGQGLQIRTDNTWNLAHRLLDLELPDAWCFGSGVFLILPAEEIPVPEYREFGSWPLETLFKLFDGLGRIPGLKMES